MATYRQEIKTFSDFLYKISKWKSSDKPFGHLTGARMDYVYEFWCGTKILQAIYSQPNQNIRLVLNTKGTFPKAPALKNEGWSYFEITNNKNEVIGQVCLGTAIIRSDAPKSEYHPDISIQKAKSGNRPNEKDVDLIMDAKFQSSFDKSDEPGCIPLHEINTFSHLVNILKVKNAFKIKLELGKLKKLKGNCIISNANVNSKHAEACEKDFVKQVGNFDLSGNYKVIGR